MEELSHLQAILTMTIDFCVKYSLQIVGACITLVIGLYCAGWLSRSVMRICETKGVDITLTLFLGKAVKGLILAFVIIVALGKFGISVTPLIAAIGAMAFGASFALQGPLSNYGAGLVIIITRPFIIGNTVSLLGVSGIVSEITLSTTILSTEDGEKITIPNKQIVGEILTNSFENIVVETTIGISYDDDPETAIALIRTIISSIEPISDTPAPQIGIQEYADSSITIGMRYWVKTEQYHSTLYSVNLSIYKAFKEAGITIPFPQRDVRIVSRSGSTEAL